MKPNIILVLAVVVAASFAADGDLFGENRILLLSPNTGNSRMDEPLPVLRFPHKKRVNRFGRPIRIFAVSRRKSHIPIRTAVGDVNGDGIVDTITARGPGNAPIVRIFDGATNEPFPPPLGNFSAFETGFAGGVFVASGDVNGDGFADVITAQGSDGGLINVFSGQDGTPLDSFTPFDPSFTGGVRVASGDINGDGFAEIVAGSGPGRNAEVRVFSGIGGFLFQTIIPYNDGFTGGVNVAIGNLDDDARNEIIIAPASKGENRPIRIFNEDDASPLRRFFAYGRSFNGGISVATTDLDRDGLSEVITGNLNRSPANVRVFDGRTLNRIDHFTAFPGFTGGVLVAAGP